MINPSILTISIASTSPPEQIGYYTGVTFNPVNGSQVLAVANSFVLFFEFDLSTLQLTTVDMLQLSPVSSQPTQIVYEPSGRHAVVLGSSGSISLIMINSTTNRLYRRSWYLNLTLGTFQTAVFTSEFQLLATNTVDYYFYCFRIDSITYAF